MTENTVLVVEDDPDRVMLTRRALSQAPGEPEVEVAETGEEAIERLCASEARPPDLVLLDLQLPGADGFDVLERVEDSEAAQVPVVVLTSSQDTEDMERSYDLGANGYVTKPVDFDEFREAVQHIAHFWLEINTPPSAGQPV